MRSFKSYLRECFLLNLVFVLCLILISISGNLIYGDETKNGDLKSYEKKSLFIFPILYNKSINSGLLGKDRKCFLSNLMYQMFVLDFRRIDFFNVKSDDSIGDFLQDIHSFLQRNIKNIAIKRLRPNGKMNEAVITDKELLETAENSFAIVPYIDSIEKKVVSGKQSNGYVYNIYVHFDIYSTKTKMKLKTLKINNKKNLLGVMASFTGSLQVDNSDIMNLPKEEREDEISFRNSIAGLFTVLKKQMKEMPEFCIMAELSMVNRSKFGFDMGTDSGIKIDHRYKTFVTRSDGRRKMTSFGKIRKVLLSYSEAQVLIGKPQEGDQVVEVPKIGINFVGGFGTTPLHIAMDLGDFYVIDIVSGSHKSLSLGLEYELGPMLGLSEWYIGMNLRLGLPSAEDYWNDYFKVSQVLINMGFIKKFYLRRLAVNFGGFIGIHGASVTYNTYDDISCNSIGFTMNGEVEYMITPSVSAFGSLNMDAYPNPSIMKRNDTEYDFPTDWEWNSKGLSMNFGVKVAF